MSSEKFIACGMYAFTDELHRAWEELFENFEPLLDGSISLRQALEFSHSEQVLRDPNLFIGQTCGYPLMTHLRDALTPFCVPRFEVPGTEGKHYRSQLIVGAESTIDCLSQCQGKIAAINTIDSNSGMNVLRYEIAKLGASPGFFAGVEVTGGHLQSLTAVGEDRAQVAAIDCVSFQLIADQWPQLLRQVRSIGFTTKTCGLPFVLPASRYSQSLAKHYTEALNQALSRVSAGNRRRLHLQGFETVTFDDYGEILELESFAINNGYAQLN